MEESNSEQQKIMKSQNSSEIVTTKIDTSGGDDQALKQQI